MTKQASVFERANNFIRKSVTLKLITITILMLLLLIPVSMVDRIIRDRQNLNHNVTHEISSKWANQQTINGPILTIPVVYDYELDDKTITKIKYWNILPKTLNISGDIETSELSRGIYNAVVYKSLLDLSGKFILDEEPQPNKLREILYDQAFLTIGLSDLRGIKNEIEVNWAGKKLAVKPGSKIPELIYSGITVKLPSLTEMDTGELDFSFSIDLKGSKNLSFIPVGNSTNIELKSAWDSPSFNGKFLPDEREVTDDGFSAKWSILQLNRNFPQSWIGKSAKPQLQESAFGLDLITPLDDYQKSYRSAKYAVMTIALTFLIFFLVEILNKRKIHPFQYALVGLALCLFYVLLVSISEHYSFNFAYGVSALMIIGMISLYSLSVFKKLNLSLLLLMTLVGIYGFLFVTLQLSDYALLLGSLGLTVILALTMYFTRHIDWYNLNVDTE